MFTKFNINKIGKCIPVKNNKNISYIRKEKDGYFSYIPSDKGSEAYKLINPTGQFILNCMNGENSLLDILNILLEKYGNEYKEQITNDLLSLVKQLWISNMINWKEGLDIMEESFKISLNDNLSVRVAFDEDIKDIMKFVKEAETKDGLLDFRNLISTSNNITPLILRYSLFSMETIIFLLENNDSLEGILAISNSPITVTGNLEFAICKKDLLEEFLVTSTKLINLVSRFECKKYRAYLANNDVSKLKKIFLDIGFDYKCKLDNEINNIDVEMFDFIFRR